MCVISNVDTIKPHANDIAATNRFDRHSFSWLYIHENKQKRKTIRGCQHGNFLKRHQNIYIWSGLPHPNVALRNLHSKNSRWKIHCNVCLSCVIESCVYSWWLFSNDFLSFSSAGYSLATRSHMIRLQSKRVNFTLSCLSVCLSLCVRNAIYPRNSNLSLQSPLKRERKEKGETTTTTHLDDPPFFV